MRMQRIEELPFFMKFYTENQVVIDTDLFWRWMNDFAFMNEEDWKDREEAFRERENGKSISLKDAMAQW